MRKIHYTHSITRTIDIEVECVYYPDYGEAEVLKAIDCSNLQPIELEDDEESECLNEGAAECMQGMADEEADRKYEDRKLGDD
jgi:hypothetical protein